MLAMPVVKRPSNMLENPVLPNIKKGPPRFMNSRKHWVSDESMINGNEGHLPDSHLYQDAILLQSRDSSRIKYGISSHRDYVNEDFRPPIETMEDREPLSRMPRDIVWGRINPQVDWYEPNNSTIGEAHKYFTNRVKDPQIAPEQSISIGGGVGKPMEHKYRAEIPQHMVVSHNYQRQDTPLLIGEAKYSTHTSTEGYSGAQQSDFSESQGRFFGGVTYSDKINPENAAGALYEIQTHIRSSPEIKLAEKMRLAGVASHSVQYEPFSDLGVSMKAHKAPVSSQALAGKEYGYVPDTEKIFITQQEKKSHKVAMNSGSESMYRVMGESDIKQKQKPEAMKPVGRNVPEGMGKGVFISPMGIGISVKK